MYVCIYIYIYMHTFKNTINICMCICMHIYIYIYISVHTHTISSITHISLLHISISVEPFVSSARNAALQPPNSFFRKCWKYAKVAFCTMCM